MFPCVDQGEGGLGQGKCFVLSLWEIYCNIADQVKKAHEQKRWRLRAGEAVTTHLWEALIYGCLPHYVQMDICSFSKGLHLLCEAWRGQNHLGLSVFQDVLKLTAHIQEVNSIQRSMHLCIASDI